MRNFLKKILLLINIILALILIICYFSAYVSPATSWIFAFIAQAYPVILILNILFIIWWLLFRKWYFLIPVLSIIISWKALKSTFQVKFGKPEMTMPENSISLLSYNVRLFNYYNWNKDTSAWKRIIDFIRSEKPDVVCLQEFITLPGTNHDLQNLKTQMAPLNYSHVYYTDQVPGKLNFGMATFSRYPIVRKKMIDFEESLNGSISTDIVVGSDTIRIYNCHLQSIRLRRDYNDLADSLLFNYSEKQLDELKDISKRMRHAYVKRAGQVNMMKQDISSSPYPVVICGDFNDTPVSYVYKTMSKNLNDIFVESGSGIGSTLRGNFPYVRIDYVLYSSEFRSQYYNILKVKFSDHYAVKAGLVIHEKADSSDLRSLPKE